MEFEWDEAERAANIAKHRLDFVDAIELFEAMHLEERARTVDGEERHLAIGRMRASQQPYSPGAAPQSD